MPRSRLNTIRMMTALTLFLSLVGWVPARAQESSRENLARRIQDLMNSGRDVEAIDLCEQYNSLHPYHPTMLYNQACLANRLGRTEEAVTSLKAAFAAGFSDLGYAEADPDLKGHGRQYLHRTIEAEKSRLVLLSKERSVSLKFGKPTPPQSLHLFPEALAAVDSETVQPQLTLQWHAQGLDLQVLAPGPWKGWFAGNNEPPWSGGPGLVVTISVPDSASTFESGNHFMFGFGLQKGAASGAMYLNGPGHWQKVLELNPKIREEGPDAVELRATIPWEAISPFDPLVDEPLGINVALRMQGDRGFRQSMLFPAMDLSLPRARLRRYVPMDFDLTSVDEEQFVGKLSASLSGSLPLDLDLMVISQAEGSGTLSIDFQDSQGRSVLPSGPLTGSLDLKRGPNSLTRQPDFTSLRTGPYDLRAEVQFPDGKRASWTTSVLHLAEGWDTGLRELIAGLVPDERPTAEHLLESVESAVLHLPARRDPGPIATTLLRLHTLLANAKERGTILPQEGTFTLAYPGPEGQTRLCLAYLPEGWDQGQELLSVMILSHGRPQDAGLTHRIGRNYEFGDLQENAVDSENLRRIVYLQPLFGLEPNTPALTILKEAEICLAWVRGYLGADTFAVAGIDQAIWPGLQMTLDHPGELAGLMCFSGARFAPWPQAQDAFVQEQLTPFPKELPISWIDFSNETDKGGQGPQFVRAIEALDLNLVDSQEVPGGLSMTQVADRLVLWASTLN